MQHTQEQINIINWVMLEGGILLVPAGAGCGKTFIGLAVVEALEPKKGLYTAFNKAIVEESVHKFRNTHMECKTLHALAYKYTQPKGGIQDLSYNDITEKISYPDKALIIENINLFYVSDSLDMYKYFDNVFGKKIKLKELAIKYVTKTLDREIPMSFNFMLKYFHLLLAEGDIVCNYDIVILDEINDTTAVALEIFKLLNAPIKLGLGESNQAIYHFLNLKDGFEELKDAKRLPLTHSFRCSTKIANNIQQFMRKYVSDEFTFSGTDEPVANGNTLYVTLTNASIILLIKGFIKEGKRFTLLRKISDIFAYPLAIISAGAGKEVYQRNYKFLEKEYKKYKKEYWQKKSWFSYLLDEIDDQETESAINLLMTLKREGTNLFDLYAKAKAIRTDPKFTIATVFTAKGMEYETVYMNRDLNQRISRIIEKGGIITVEDLVAFRCYYVAASRAGTNLYNAVHFNP